MNSLTLQLLRVHGYDEPLHVGESEEDDCGGDGRPLGGVPQRQDPLRVHHQRLGERVLGGRSARFKLDLRVFGSSVLLLVKYYSVVHQVVHYVCFTLKLIVVFNEVKGGYTVFSHQQKSVSNRMDQPLIHIAQYARMKGVHKFVDGICIWNILSV